MKVRSCRERERRETYKSISQSLPKAMMAFVIVLLMGGKSYADSAGNNTTRSTNVLVTARRTTQTKDAIDRYSTQNIDNLAAMTIGEVITRLERRNGGRPFSIIVNGRRLADISDLREIPPEALAGLEILPNSSAGRYGFGPENKVLNLVLKRKFSSLTTSPELHLPTEGGGDSGDAAFRYVTIRGEKRFNAAVSGQETEALYGQDRRHLFDDDSEDAMLTPYRTLSPFNRRLALIPGFAIPIGSISVNGSGSLTEVVSRQLTRFFTSGTVSNELLPGEADHSITTHGIIDQSHTRSYRLGLTVSGMHKRLNWSAELTGAFSSSDTDSHISRKTITAALPSGSLSQIPSTYTPLLVGMGNTDLGAAVTVNTPLFSLPAGDMSANARLSTNFQRLDSTYSFIQSDHQSNAQMRSRAHFGVAIPLTSPNFPVIQIPGTTSLSLNSDYEQAQHVGSLPSYDFSWQWQPIDALAVSLGRSMTGSLTTLGSSNAPVIYPPGTLVVDAVTGNYALITEISGGTPNLHSSSRTNNTARISFNKMVGTTNLAATVEYVSSRITNPIISAVTPNPQFQRLFPNRFTRDATGQLTMMDSRPFNAAGETTNTLHPNLHVSGTVVPHGKTSEHGLDWDFSLSDEWALNDELRPAQGTANVDLLKTPLDGVRGTPRHKVDGEAETSWRRFNLQLSAEWRSGSRVQDIAASEPYSVHYAGFWTADAVVSYTFKIKKKSLRVWISVSNIFDRQQKVRDSAGHTPEAYQPAFLDPAGRIVAIRTSIPL
ncbi:hypothetical protein HLH36_17145 [Gluconacetobacter aggeris]|uniref:Outer membrane receptor protein involved in Fe transport n=1 Tax=Gluconacetobacter aggeris TaxID=1286186 RepID=A0A7W4IVY4_9PROT|nr:hypothetical protein [Gluconacetobacter aggeris]MBB2170049.1 hypothetical protein [Gluconacetobacter aggeris]